MALTPKQTEFCRVFMETGNASEAYRSAYNVEKMTPGMVATEACNLLKNPNVALTLQSAQTEILKKPALTREDLLAELEEARQAALCAETPQAGAATSATMGKAKLLGLDKIIIDHQSSDGTMSPKIADLSDEDLEQKLRAYGITK